MHNKRLIVRVLLAAGALAAVAAMSAAMSALSAAESSLSFATAPQTVAAGQTSGVITVALPSGSTGPATVKLTSSSQTGKFRNQADSAYVTSVSIASGKTQASFRYRDNAAGAPVITGAATSKQWAGTISGRQTETVTPAALDHLTLAPGSGTVESGKSQAYTATGFDQYGNSLGDVTAQTTFTISPDGSCTGASCVSTTAGAHTVAGTDGTARGQASLSITAGTLDHLVLSPAAASRNAGEAQTYTATGFDQYGNSLGDVTAQTTFTISPDGSCTGASCGATAAGTHTVTGTDLTASGTASLSVTAAAVDHLALSPAAASRNAGESQTYTATGFDQYGNSLGDVTAQTAFTISPDGTCSGASCGSTTAGAHTVTGTDGTASGTASLSVTAAALDHLALNPSSSSLKAGESQTYTATGLDQYGNSLGDVTAQTAFTISPDGTCSGASCTATKAGAHTVTGTDGTASGQATLQIQGPPTTVSITFDDGVSDQAQAGQMLAEHAMAGTFFIISGRVGTPGNLSLSNLNQLVAGGSEIGDHTVGHLNLTTVSTEEAERQVCNARVQLENWGFHVWDFAYPQGGATPQLEQIVRNCNLNSARVAANLASPANGDCLGCPYAETIPPRDPYAIATPDSIRSANTLQDIENYVIQAQQHGGGWVPLIFHHICDGCNPEAVTAATFSAFLDWLRAQSPYGVTVKTVHEVIGGADLPPVTGPPPPPPSGDVIQNPSFEADQDGNGVPDCWTIGGSGTNAWTAGLTPEAHTGTFAEQISISNWTSGDRRLITTQDLGQCAPLATPGHTYTVSAYLKGQGTMKWVVYYRDSQGVWNYWAQSAAINVGSSYGQLSWTTPPVPSAATALSIGVSLRSVGTVTADDFFMSDNGASDQTPPSVQITAPASGASVEGKVTISANATDNVGVSSVKFLLDGALLGTKTAPTPTGSSTYQWKWDTTTASEGQHTLTAIASDAVGNQGTSAPVTVTVSRDTTPPVTTILCNGSSPCSAWYRAPVSLTLKATDNVAVAHTYYTSDGTEPSATNGTVYTGAFNIAQSSTVKYRSVDTAGNWEQVQSRLLQIDTQAPAAQITAPAAGATVSGTAVYIVAQATDNVSVSSVRFFLDGVSLGSKSSPTTPGGSTYQWKWDSTAASKGAHTLTATATDQAGNPTTSAPVQVTVG